MWVLNIIALGILLIVNLVEEYPKEEVKIMTFKKRCRLYELISKIPRISPLSLKLVLGCSSKKLERYLNRLKEDGLIKEENNRYYPTPWREIINWDEMRDKYGKK